MFPLPLVGITLQVGVKVPLKEGWNMISFIEPELSTISSTLGGNEVEKSAVSSAPVASDETASVSSTAARLRAVRLGWVEGVDRMEVLLALSSLSCTGGSWRRWPGCR